MNWKLKEIIIKKFKTQADFAKAIHMHEPVVSRVIRGRQVLSLEDQEIWAKALGCKTGDIFPVKRRINR